MWQWSVPASVHVFMDRAEVIRGSWDIACYAAARAGDGRLGDLAAVEPWNVLSEAAPGGGGERPRRGGAGGGAHACVAVGAGDPRRARRGARRARSPGVAAGAALRGARC